METKRDPYLEALELVKQHAGTSGQAALAKCILSLYNGTHGFSVSGHSTAPCGMPVRRYLRWIQGEVNRPGQ